MKKSFSNYILSFICFTFLFCFLAGNSLLCFANSQSTVFTNVLRLHVIASGNSPSEQALKLKVRDAILERTADLFKDCKNIEQALATAKQNSSILCQTAKTTAQQNGYNGNVSIEISRENYPEKTYGQFTFPSGNYLSVRVILGQGLGKNWWCVLFPPLCNAGIEDGKNILLTHGFEEKDIKKLQSQDKHKGIKIKDTKVSLKLLELFS